MSSAFSQSRRAAGRALKSPLAVHGGARNAKAGLAHALSEAELRTAHRMFLCLTVRTARR
jgi:hypothetical protein